MRGFSSTTCSGIIQRMVPKPWLNYIPKKSLCYNILQLTILKMFSSNSILIWLKNLCSNFCFWWLIVNIIMKLHIKAIRVKNRTNYRSNESITDIVSLKVLLLYRYRLYWFDTDLMLIHFGLQDERKRFLQPFSKTSHSELGVIRISIKFVTCGNHKNLKYSIGKIYHKWWGMGFTGEFILTQILPITESKQWKTARSYHSLVSRLVS